MDIVYKKPKYQLKLSIRKIPHKAHEYLAIYKCTECNQIVLRAKVNHFGLYDIRPSPCEHVRNKMFFKRIELGL